MMSVSEDRIFKLAVALIVFQMSIPIAAIIMPNQPLSGATGFDLLTLSLKNWTTWVSISALGTLAITGLVLRVPLSAVVFASIMTTGTIPVTSTYKQVMGLFVTSSGGASMETALLGVINGIWIFLTVWTFIKLSR